MRDRRDRKVTGQEESPLKAITVESTAGRPHQEDIPKPTHVAGQGVQSRWARDPTSRSSGPIRLGPRGRARLVLGRITRSVVIWAKQRTAESDLVDWHRPPSSRAVTSARWGSGHVPEQPPARHQRRSTACVRSAGGSARAMRIDAHQTCWGAVR
jgi:hypothetical protein